MNKTEREALKALLKRRAEEHTQTADSALKWLVGEGLLNENGELQARFGGETKDEDPA